VTVDTATNHVRFLVTVIEQTFRNCKQPDISYDVLMLLIYQFFVIITSINVSITLILYLSIHNKTP